MDCQEVPTSGNHRSSILRHQDPVDLNTFSFGAHLLLVFAISLLVHDVVFCFLFWWVVGCSVIRALGEKHDDDDDDDDAVFSFLQKN